MKSLTALNRAVAAGIQSGDYRLLDNLLGNDNEPADGNNIGALDPFGVFARELANATRKERDQPVDAEARAAVLGDPQQCESSGEVAGKEQSGSVQRDVQAGVQAGGSGI